MLVAAALIFGLMAFVAKLATDRLPGAEVAFVRFVVGVVCVAGYGLGVRRLRMHNPRVLLLRGLFGGAAVLLYFVAIEKLSVGLATLLNYTAPVFTAIDAALVLGERVTRGTALALLVTFAGVVLVIEGHAQPGHSGFGPWVLCGLGSAILSGAAVTAIRAARRTEGAWEIFGAFCVFGVITTLPFAAHQWVPPTARDWLLLVAVGLLSVVAQVLMTVALRDVRAAHAGVILQLTPVTAVVLGVLFNHDRFGLLALLGSALTVVGAGWAAWTSTTPPRPKVDPTKDLVASG